jgi:hypothetical protein
MGLTLAICGFPLPFLRIKAIVTLNYKFSARKAARTTAP